MRVGPPCGTPCSLAITTPSGSTTLAFSIRPISTSSRRSGLARELRHQPLMADEIEELLQIKIHAPLVAVLEMPLGLGDRRVATSAGSKPVAGRMERRLPQRFEHLPHGLLDHPVDHVGNPQSALPASRLGDQHPADPARPIRPLSAGRPAARAARPATAHAAPRSSARPDRERPCSTPPSTTHPSIARQPPPSSPALPSPPLSIAFGAPARISPSRSRDLLRVAPRGFSAVAIAKLSCTAVSSTGTAFPCPPGLDPAGSAGITPPSGTTRSSDFCWAIEPSSFRSPAYRPTRRNPADLPG